MKKFVKSLIFSLILLGVIPLSGCKKSNKIIVAEVTHSMFYAPLYIAYNGGFFDNLDLEIITTPGADKVTSSILSKAADIGLCGPEAAIYVYQNGALDFPITFAQLTSKDGSFLLGREKIDNFTFDMLKGKTIIGGRKGGMPLMILEEILKRNNISFKENDSTGEVNIRTDVSFDAATGVFVAGESDFVTAFEPVGTQLEKANKGYIITSLGDAYDEIPYTCFMALKSYLKENQATIQKFVNGITSGLNYILNEPMENIVSLLKPSFPSSDEQEISQVITNYLNIQVWKDSCLLLEDNYQKLINIIKSAGELNQDATIPYNQLVDVSFCQN